MTVSINEARLYQQVGTWVDNPKYTGAKNSAELPKHFKATYVVLWRPEPLPEDQQYAIVTLA